MRFQLLSSCSDANHAAATHKFHSVLPSLRQESPAVFPPHSSPAGVREDMVGTSHPSGPIACCTSAQVFAQVVPRSRAEWLGHTHRMAAGWADAGHGPMPAAHHDGRLSMWDTDRLSRPPPAHEASAPAQHPHGSPTTSHIISGGWMLEGVVELLQVL